MEGGSITKRATVSPGGLQYHQEGYSITTKQKEGNLVSHGPRGTEGGPWAPHQTASEAWVTREPQQTPPPPSAPPPPPSA